MTLPDSTLTTSDRPLKDVPQAELQKRHDELEALASDITRAYFCVVKAVDAAVDSVIMALPRDLWKYFKAGDPEKAFGCPPENDAVYSELEAVEYELKERRLDEQDGIAQGDAA